jgi:hypothetical protein
MTPPSGSMPLFADPNAEPGVVQTTTQGTVTLGIERV